MALFPGRVSLSGAAAFEVLADALAVGGTDGQRIRLAQALANRRDRCSSRVRTKLRFLRGDLTGDAGELLAWA